MDEAVSSVGEDGKTYAEEAFAELEEAAAAAHKKFEDGDYAGALAAAEEVKAKAEEVKQAAAAKKEELTSAWNELAEELPGKVGEAKAKVEELSKARRLPKGMDRATVEAAKSGLEEIEALWTEAKAAFDGGNLGEAAEKGQSVKAKLEGIMESLGMGSEE